MTWKPEGYPSVAPYLLVRDARETLTFLARTFDAAELRVIPSPPEKGGIMHAEARIDDTVIMMGETADGPPAHIHVYVPDAHEVFARAVAAGATPVQQVEDKGDGDIRGGVRDRQGTTWWIASSAAG